MIHYLTKPHIASIIALIFYGSWAALANFDFEISVIVNAFLIQGCFAFASTFFSAHLALLVFRKFANYKHPLLFSYLFMMALLVLIPYSLHSFYLTPNKLLAMAPGVIIGTVYIALLLRAQKRPDYEPE
jgi:lysylphosphatidylglycerol synthetase-like protein (DUF2156 family)